MTTTKLREWFCAEQGKPIEVYWEGSIENPAYTDWLERRLIQALDRYQDNEADGIVFCGKCGKVK